MNKSKVSYIIKGKHQRKKDGSRENEGKLRFMMCGKWLNGAKYGPRARKISRYADAFAMTDTELCLSICIMRFKSS